MNRRGLERCRRHTPNKIFRPSRVVASTATSTWEVDPQHHCALCLADATGRYLKVLRNRRAEMFRRKP